MHVAIAAERVEHVLLAAVDIDRHEVTLVIARIAGIGISRCGHVDVGVTVLRRGDTDVRRSFFDIAFQRDQRRPARTGHLLAAADVVSVDITVKAVSVNNHADRIDRRR